MKSLELCNEAGEHDVGKEAPEEGKSNQDDDAFPVADGEAFHFEVQLRNIMWSWHVSIIHRYVRQCLVTISDRGDPLQPAEVRGNGIVVCDEASEQDHGHGEGGGDRGCGDHIRRKC